MKANTRTLLLVLVGVAVSAACLAYLVNMLAANWQDAVSTYRRTDWLCLVPALGLICLLYWCRVLRWQLFLRPIKRVGALNAASATCIGFMTNNILGARLGEIVRPYVLQRNEGVRFGHGLATVGLSRVFDLIGLSILLLITWALLSARAWEPPQPSGSVAGAEAPAQAAERVGEPPSPAQDGPVPGHSITIRDIWYAGMVGAAVALGALAVLLGLALFPRPFLKLGERCTGVLPRAWRPHALGLLRSIAEAMGFLKNWRGVGLAVVYSAGVWLAQGTSTYALARGMDVPLGLAGAFLVTLVVSAAIALPQAPLYAGVYPLAAALVTEVLHAGNRSEAAAFALLVWLVNVAPITLVGLGFLWREGLSLAALASGSRGLRDGASPPA